MKLRTKFLLITGTIIIVSISLIGIFNTMTTDKAFTETINLQLHDELANFERAID